WGTVMTAPTVQRPSKTIHWPAYSIVGAATPEKFYGSLTASDLESGFINRWLVLPHAGFGKPKERRSTEIADKDNPPEELLEGLRKLPQQKPLDQPADGSLPVRKQVEWAAEAEDVYFELVEKMYDLERTDKQRFELGQRTTENAVRLATIVA